MTAPDGEFFFQENNFELGYFFSACLELQGQELWMASEGTKEIQPGENINSS